MVLNVRKYKMKKKWFLILKNLVYYNRGLENRFKSIRVLLEVFNILEDEMKIG